MNQLPLAQINQVIKKYFEENPSLETMPAKDLMPQFIKAGIFSKDHQAGLPIRNVLRELDRTNSLHLIPHVRPERKAINTNWFFDNFKKKENITIVEGQHFKQITEEEYNRGIDDVKRREFILNVSLKRGDESKQTYIEVLIKMPLIRTLVKTYLNNLYKDYWDNVKFAHYEKQKKES